jgi:hypothetical protein
MREDPLDSSRYGERAVKIARVWRSAGQHFREGLSSRLLKPEELFHPASLESFKI